MSRHCIGFICLTTEIPRRPRRPRRSRRPRRPRRPSIPRRGVLYPKEFSKWSKTHNRGKLKYIPKISQILSQTHCAKPTANLALYTQKMLSPAKYFYIHISMTMMATTKTMMMMMKMMTNWPDGLMLAPAAALEGHVSPPRRPP